MAALVSFIIPAYNAEKTIKACVESILKIQSFEIEVVVVDDGSKDTTRQKLGEILDKRLKVLSIDNGGVSNARNYGMSKARGKYIAFADADDLVISGAFEKIISELDDGTEVLIYGYTQNNKGRKEFFEVPCKGGRYDNRQCMEIIHKLLDVPIYTRKENHYMGAKIWQYLYLKDYLVKNNIFFNKKIAFAEDLCFCVDVLSKVQWLQSVEVFAYEYIITEGTASKKYRNEYWNELKKVYAHVSSSLGCEIPQLYVGYGKIATRHLFMYPVASKTKREWIKIILQDDKFHDFLLRENSVNKTLSERIEDYGYLKKSFIIIKLFLEIRYFPIYIYRKLKGI